MMSPHTSGWEYFVYLTFEMMRVSPTSVSEKNDSLHIYIHTYLLHFMDLLVR
jgi:hypothetical protein